MAGASSAFLLASSMNAFALETGSASGGFFHWRPFLGPFHSLVLHYPIGFLTMAFILEIYAWRKPGVDLRRVTRLVIWLSLLSGLLSAALGIMRATGGGYDPLAIERHRWFGLAVPVFTLLTLFLQNLAYRLNARTGLLAAYRVLLAGTLALLVVASHYGGNLTHGTRYLTQNAPGFVKNFLETSTTTPVLASTNLSEGQRLFVEKVRPILETKCVSCHGPEKQKGKLRLDRPEFAFRPGESGKPGIKPGEPLASETVRLILLPRTDDNAMPPEGKEPLSAGEIIDFVHWIQAGANFVETSATDLRPSSNAFSLPEIRIDSTRATGK